VRPHHLSPLALPLSPPGLLLAQPDSLSPSPAAAAPPFASPAFAQPLCERPSLLRLPKAPSMAPKSCFVRRRSSSPWSVGRRSRVVDCSGSGGFVSGAFRDYRGRAGRGALGCGCVVMRLGIPLAFAVAVVIGIAALVVYVLRREVQDVGSASASAADDRRVRLVSGRPLYSDGWRLRVVGPSCVSGTGGDGHSVTGVMVSRRGMRRRWRVRFTVSHHRPERNPDVRRSRSLSV
jgi:hypothetical protein